jgi:hypothetical protein
MRSALALNGTADIPGGWMGVAPSHLGLLSPLCRSRRFWGGATLTSERQVPLSQGGRSLRYPTQAPSPADPCNKVPGRAS